MTIQETQQYIEKVRRELNSVGTSVPAVKKALKKLNAELEGEKANLNYGINKGKIPEYVLIEQRKNIAEKEQIIRRVYQEEFEELSTPRQIKLVQDIATAVPGSGEAAPVQKFIAGLFAFFFVIIFWSAAFLALYIFLIKDSEFGKNNLLAILVTIITAIVIFEIAMGGQNIIFGFIYKISRFIYKIFFGQVFLFLGGSKEELRKMRERK
jgi:hypothetical protein